MRTASSLSGTGSAPGAGRTPPRGCSARPAGAPCGRRTATGSSPCAWSPLRHPAAVEQHLGPFLLGQVVVASAPSRPRPRLMTGPVKLPASSGSPMRSRFAVVDELLGEAVDQLLVHEDAARRDAALAARLEGADEAARHRQVEPGVLADDDGALAAHLAGDDAVVNARPRPAGCAGRPRSCR